MTYNNVALIIFGVFLMLTSGLPLRGAISDGLYHRYRGEVVRIDRHEQPLIYWSEIVLLLSTAAIGMWMIGEGSFVRPY